MLYGYSFTVYIKTDDIYRNIAEGVETRFDTSNYQSECNAIDRSLPKVKNKKVLGLIKGELGRKITTKLVGLRAKTYSNLIDEGSEGVKAKDTKKCVIKGKFTLENYKNSIEATQLKNKINDLGKYKIDMDSIKKNQKDFIKNNKSILKIQQKFKMFSLNVFPMFSLQKLTRFL